MIPSAQRDRHSKRLGATVARYGGVFQGFCQLIIIANFCPAYRVFLVDRWLESFAFRFTSVDYDVAPVVNPIGITCTVTPQP